MKANFGLNQTLRIIGLPKKTWYYQQREKGNNEVKYRQMKSDLLLIAKDNPSYGYRRTTAELREEYGCLVNQKPVRKLMKDQQIQLIKKARKPKPSIVAESLLRLGDKMNLVATILAKGEKIDLFQVCYTDFTELIYSQGNKKAQLMPIIEHLSKTALGWSLGKTANTETALKAWRMVVKTTKSLGFSTKGLIVHHDRDPVYTGYEWLGQILLVDQAKISYALRGAKDNTVMESFNSHFKEENRGLFWECETLTELKRVVEEQMLYYNTKRRHSSSGNAAPIIFLKERQKQSRF